ncbi:MAG: phosphatase PAP2 family protein, partial [Sphingomonadaceae bacterium]|nr:phosphatase PAP2 family protein [Sphingomonadaceae bacterium]
MARRSPRTGFTPRLLAAIAAIGAAIWGFLALADEVGEGGTAKVDRALILALRQSVDPNRLRGPAWLQETARDITALGGFTVLGLVTVAALAVLIVYRRHRQAIVFAAAAVGAQVTAEAIKNYVGRPRPSFVHQYDLIASSSFPSGHSMMAPAIYFT